MQKPIILVGFMGSGKTTWGKKIAQALGVPFIDLDQEIVAHIGMSIPAYFAAHGEDSFRKLEHEFLLQQGGKHAVISTGGGTPCYYNNMEWIQNNGLSVYLYHTVNSLYARLSQSDIKKRPILQGLSGDDLHTFIETKLSEREHFYNQAHIRVEQIHTPLLQLIELINTHQHAYLDKK